MIKVYFGPDSMEQLSAAFSKFYLKTRCCAMIFYDQKREFYNFLLIFTGFPR